MRLREDHPLGLWQIQEGVTNTCNICDARFRDVYHKVNHHCKDFLERKDKELAA